MAALGNVSSMDLLRELGRRYGEEKWMQNRSKKLIFLGAPGCGKGTQAFMLKDHFEVSHISTGDLIREMTKNKTSELGKKLAGVMERGELVDDALITELVVKKIGSDECKKGFILDGFPRTIVQAQSLEEALAAEQKSLDSVFYFDMPHGELSRRITGRRVHPPSGRSYHIEFNPPKVEGKDDETGDDLIQRKDDTEEVRETKLGGFRTHFPSLDSSTPNGCLHQANIAFGGILLEARFTPQARCCRASLKGF
eukprot:GHVN01067131.1.p1 GENE.GHVN01067131.1~~GHVN01067131.1.p1  ORF type:complete len:253 (-),score=34.73 GHVN01067131.1:400-1158(-)